MRFLSLYKPGKDAVPPSEEQLAEFGKFNEQLAKSGALLATEGCQPSAKGCASADLGRHAQRDRRAVHRDEGADRRLRTA